MILPVPSFYLFFPQIKCDFEETEVSVHNKDNKRGILVPLSV